MENRPLKAIDWGASTDGCGEALRRYAPGQDRAVSDGQRFGVYDA